MTSPAATTANRCSVRLASYVRDQQVPLELCPTSNVQTGAAASIAEHPIRMLDDLGFRVTVNCDDQLMTGTRLSDEFAALCRDLGYDLEGVRRLSQNAAGAAFAPLPLRAAADRADFGVSGLIAPIRRARPVCCGTRPRAIRRRSAARSR